MPVTALLNTVVKRMNEASGLYQMFGVLVDVMALNRFVLEIALVYYSLLDQALIKNCKRQF